PRSTPPRRPRRRSEGILVGSTYQASSIREHDERVAWYPQARLAGYHFSFILQSGTSLLLPTNGKAVPLTDRPPRFVLGAVPLVSAWTRSSSGVRIALG